MIRAGLAVVCLVQNEFAYRDFGIPQRNLCRLKQAFQRSEVLSSSFSADSSECNVGGESSGALDRENPVGAQLRRHPLHESQNVSVRIIQSNPNDGWTGESRKRAELCGTD